MYSCNCAFSDGLVLFENLPYETQNLDGAGPESLRQLDVEVCFRLLHYKSYNNYYNNNNNNNNNKSYEMLAK